MKLRLSSIIKKEVKYGRISHGNRISALLAALNTVGAVSTDGGGTWRFYKS